MQSDSNMNAIELRKLCCQISETENQNHRNGKPYYGQALSSSINFIWSLNTIIIWHAYYS